MEWYNPASWFETFRREATPVYCHNPSCNGVIEKEKLAYDKERKEAYHDLTCAAFAAVVRVVKSGVEHPTSGRANFETIPLRKARKLLKKGELVQPEGIEKKALNF